MLSCRGNGSAVFKRCSLLGLPTHRSYSSKVRVFPFVVPPEKALEELSWNVSLFTGDRLFGAWLRRQLPGLNVKTLQPLRFQAVYLPTWIIDAEVTANMWFKPQADGAEAKKETAQAQFTHCVMPGYIFPPLSVKNLMAPKLLGVEPVPWSEDLRWNGEDDVLCLPFSMTPFPLLDLARSLSLTDANIGKRIRFDPSSVKELMMAAYPILLPGYLAQFEVRTLVDGKATTDIVTAFMEASYDEPRVLVEIVPGVVDFFKAFNLAVPDVIVRRQHANTLGQMGVVRSLLAVYATLNHKRYLERWINIAGTSLTALPAYRERYFGKTEQQAAHAINWEDVRIRPFTREEQEANRQYITAGEELFFVEQVARAAERKRENAESPAQGGQMASTGPPLVDAEALQNHTVAAEKKRQERKPEWLAQYEIQQRLSADTSRVVDASSATGESNTGKASNTIGAAS